MSASAGTSRSPPIDHDAASGSSSKKRRRVVVACDTCRRKKVKCQGLPNPTNTCENCTNMGYTCSFTVEPDRSRGRYEILESQRDTLLMALQSVAPELAGQFERGELNIANPNGGGAKPPSNGYDVKQPSMPQHSSDAHQPTSPDPFPSSSAMVKQEESNPMVPDLEDGRPRYYGGSSSLRCFNEIDSIPSSPTMQARKLMAAQTQTQHYAATQDASARPGKATLSVVPPPMPQYPRNSVDWVRELRRKTLVAVGRDEVFASEGWFNRFPLPSPDLLNEVLDHYFARLHPLLPMLHEDTLRRDLAMGRADRDSAFRGLIFTILTISARFFRNDPRVLANPSDPDSAGDHWAAASRFHHQVYAASLINVQVLLLSCAFMPSALGIGTSWTVLGVAIRALQDIGLHTEKAYVGYTPFEQERRRRTFWAAFCLDSILCINMGRPLALRSDDISLRYPLLASEQALSEAERTGGPLDEISSRNAEPCVASGFIHLIKVCSIVRETLTTLYQPSSVTSALQKRSPSYKDMALLSQKLDEWVANIPHHLLDIAVSPFPIQATLLHCGRNNVRMYILKPFIYDMRSSLPPAPAAKAQNDMEDGSVLRRMLLPQCTSHARGTLKAVQALNETIGMPFSFFLLCQSFLSASTFILTIWHSTKDAEMLRADSRIIEFTLRIYNQESKFASVLLQRAHRLLRNVALRCLNLLSPDDPRMDSQRKRLQELLRQNGMTSGRMMHGMAANIQGGNRNGNMQAAPITAATAVAASGSSDGSHPSVPISSYVNSSHTFSYPSSPHGSNTGRSTPATGRHAGSGGYGRIASPYMRASESGFGVGSGGGFANAFGANEIFANDHLDALDVQQWLPFSQHPTPTKFMQDESDGMSVGFNGDQSWTDYFARFLGGLPDPTVGGGGSGSGIGIISGNGSGISGAPFSLGSPMVGAGMGGGPARD